MFWLPDQNSKNVDNLFLCSNIETPRHQRCRPSTHHPLLLATPTLLRRGNNFSPHSRRKVYTGRNSKKVSFLEKWLAVSRGKGWTLTYFSFGGGVTNWRQSKLFRSQVQKLLPSLHPSDIQKLQILRIGKQMSIQNWKYLNIFCRSLYRYL